VDGTGTHDPVIGRTPRVDRRWGDVAGTTRRPRGSAPACAARAAARTPGVVLSAPPCGRMAVALRASAAGSGVAEVGPGVRQAGAVKAHRGPGAAASRRWRRLLRGGLDGPGRQAEHRAAPPPRRDAESAVMSPARAARSRSGRMPRATRSAGASSTTAPSARSGRTTGANANPGSSDPARSTAPVRRPAPPAPSAVATRPK
jgi:hypothetical protein